MSESKDFIDASLFMGMHSQDEATRIACKNFFVERLHSSVMMSLEHVGRCDDMVWQYGREVQDAYYPFMDNLHTDMRIVRRGCEEQDLRLALTSPLLQELPMLDRLLLAMVINRGGDALHGEPAPVGASGATGTGSRSGHRGQVP